MKYQIHPNLNSFFDLAIALFNEVAEGGPSFGGLLRDARLSQVIEVADTFGKLALHEATTAEEYIRMNIELTDAARAADERFQRGSNSFYSTGNKTFADSHPGFEETSTVRILDEQPDLFIRRGNGGAGGELFHMTKAAYSIMPTTDSEDFGAFVLGLCLLVAAHTLSMQRQSGLPMAIAYPMMDDVTMPAKVFHTGGTYNLGPQELQFRVDAMARAIAARLPAKY